MCFLSTTFPNAPAQPLPPPPHPLPFTFWPVAHILRATIAVSLAFFSIFLLYVLSDHPIILWKCTPGWRGCKIASKGGLFFTLPKRVTSPTWGPPLPCKQALNVGYLLRYIVWRISRYSWIRINQIFFISIWCFIYLYLTKEFQRN